MLPKENIRIRVLYFAQVREAVGANEEEYAVPATATVADLFSKVVESHPQLHRLKRSIQVSLNRKMAKRSAVLRDRDEVALLPPVTGG